MPVSDTQRPRGWGRRARDKWIHLVVGGVCASVSGGGTFVVGQLNKAADALWWNRYAQGCSATPEKHIEQHSSSLPALAFPVTPDGGVSLPDSRTVLLTVRERTVGHVTPHAFTPWGIGSVGE